MEPDPTQMQVIALTRFSYPAIGGFQVEHDSVAEREAFLYAPERMEQRFRAFETITLPAMRAQTDPDFKWVIVVGESLPTVWRDRMEGLVAGLAQVTIRSMPPGPHRDVMRQVINDARSFNAAPCLQFRMDDDDAVAVDFVARLREVAGTLVPFLESRRLFAIDFNQGYRLAAGPDGVRVVPTTDPYFTAALALMIKPEVRATIMNFGHRKLPRKMATVTLTGEDMLIRGHGDYNDSRMGKRLKPLPFRDVDDAMAAHLKSRFAIDVEEIARLWSA